MYNALRKYLNRKLIRRGYQGYYVVLSGGHEYITYHYLKDKPPKFAYIFYSKDKSDCVEFINNKNGK